MTPARTYRSGWRVVLVVSAAAALLPGGDPVSMALLMLPLVVLYAAGVALSARFGRAPAWRAG